MAFWSIIVIIIGIFTYLTYTKIEFVNLRNRSKKIVAKVVEYRKEKGPIRNDYTYLEYPYVKIDLEDADYTIRRLKYAKSGKKPFKIGQEVDVFWYGSNLLYWHAYDNGIHKYIPSKWNFLS